MIYTLQETAVAGEEETPETPEEENEEETPEE